MEYWLSWARGTAFLFAFSFMVLGLVRHVVLTGWEIGRILHRAGDRALPSRQLVRSTVEWLVPYRKLRHRVTLGVTSLLFHVAIICVPIFLAGHIELWARATGLSWPAIPNRLADVLTVLALLTAPALCLQRVLASDTRALSRFQDYALPLVVALPFLSGFLLMHPTANPLSFETTLLVHVLSASFVLVLIPITKLVHMALMPGTQLISELAWHWPPDGGSKVAAALGKEKELI